MKTSLIALAAAVILAPSMAFADQITTRVETTNDGYYMNRPMSNMASPRVIRNEYNDEYTGDDTVTVRDTATVVTNRYKTKFGSDTGFDSNSPSPKSRVIQDKDVETTTSTDTRVIR